MRIKHVVVKPNTFLDFPEDDWVVFNAQIMRERDDKGRWQPTVVHVFLVRGQDRETLDFCRAMKTLNAQTIIAEIQKLSPPKE